MDTSGDVWALLSLPEVMPMTDGYHVAVRVGYKDANSNRPHGIDYAIQLMSETGKVLGFDNAHAYDGAQKDAPWDHEHPFGAPHRHLPYEFRSADVLVSDFFDRVSAFIDKHEEQTGTKLQFLEGAEL